MAKSQYVNIILQAVDRASGVVGKIGNAFSGLKAKAEEATGATGSLSNAIAFGMAKYNAVVGLAQTGISKLQGMMGEASSLQLENMSAAQTFAAVAGKSFDEGAQFIDNLTAELSKAAAVLPGATSDYVALGRSIQDNLIDAFKGSDGKLKDMAGFEGALMSISKSFGVLSAASQVPIGNTALGLTKALSGGSIAELRQIQAFEQNPALLNELEKRLEKVGAKSLKDLDMKARVALIKEVGEKFVDSSYQKRAAQTLDGLWQGFVSGWFDPNTGVFGLMRDLDPQTKGVQSAFKSMNDLMASLLGSGGLYEQVSGLLADMGIGIDPMRLLRDGIVWIDGWVKRLSEGIAWLRSFMASGGDITSGLAILMSNASGMFDIATIGARINAGLAWISQSVLGFINSGIQAIALWLNSLQPTAGAEIGAAIGIFLGNLVGNIINFVTGLDWANIFVIIGRVSIQLIGAIGGFIIGFGATVQGHIMTGIGQVMKAIMDGLRTLIQAIGQIVQAKIQEMVQAVQTLSPQGLADIASGQISAAQGAANAEARYQAALANAKAKYKGHIGDIPNAAQGFIPNAADGFMGAIAREMSAMPRGASPVVANTSETILTPNMLRNLVTGSVAAGAGGGSSFSPTVVVNGGMGDGEAIAKEVLRYLEIFFDEHVQGQLA